MSLTLGEKLRQTREERGISISEVAEQTRISPHYIKSMENDDYKPLPGGIFNKGFVKSYAKYVGLDENEALQDYAAIAAQLEESSNDEIRSYRPEVLTDDQSTPSIAPTIVFAVIILGLMTAGILFLVRYLQSQPSGPAANSNALVAANTSVNGAPETSPEQVPAGPADQISVQLRAISEPVWTTYTVDGASKIQTLAAEESVTIDVKDSFRISYSKAKADKLKITLNGKDVAPPSASPKGTIDFEINKANVEQIMKSGEISGGPASPTETKTPAVQPKPSPKVSPSASVRAVATPSRRPATPPAGNIR